MFPFQRSGELSFQTAEFIDEEQNMVENQIYWTTDVASAGVEGSLNTDVGPVHGNRGRGQGRGRGRVSNDCNDDNDDKKKKTIHREVERQRRMEMSNLFSSLHSTLPPEYVEGKKSTSDHLAEAVNYIKDLEKNVQELSNKRDKLAAAPKHSAPTYQVGESSNNPRPCLGSVLINPCLGGLNIDINVGYQDENFSLSSALRVVFGEGLTVSSCISTKVNARMVHRIVCEVTDMTCIDLSRLQQRLTDLVS